MFFRGPVRERRSRGQPTNVDQPTMDHEILTRCFRFCHQGGVIPRRAAIDRIPVERTPTSVPPGPGGPGYGIIVRAARPRTPHKPQYPKFGISHRSTSTGWQSNKR